MSTCYLAYSRILWENINEVTVKQCNSAVKVVVVHTGTGTGFKEHWNVQFEIKKVQPYIHYDSVWTFEFGKVMGFWSPHTLSSHWWMVYFEVLLIWGISIFFQVANVTNSEKRALSSISFENKNYFTCPLYSRKTSFVLLLISYPLILNMYRPCFYFLHFFFSTKSTHVLQKKSFPDNFCVFWPILNQFKYLFWKSTQGKSVSPHPLRAKLIPVLSFSLLHCPLFGIQHPFSRKKNMFKLAKLSILVLLSNISLAFDIVYN